MSITKTILTIHTNEATLDLIAAELQTLGNMQITKTYSGYSAIQLMHRNVYDFVVMDVDLDQIDAWQLTRLIRSGVMLSPADTPVFLISNSYSEHLAHVTARVFEVNRFINIDNIKSLPEIIKPYFSHDNRSINKPTLLVVEDYPDTATLIERTLQKSFVIEIATDGDSGLNAWLRGRHDLVLLDIMLPKMRGDEVLARILETDRNQSVVMMTAHDSGDQVSKLILQGAIDFINKPFRTEQLRNVCTIASQRLDFITSHQEFSAYQQQLYAQNESFSVTLESLSEGVITVDNENNVTYLNQALINLFSWRPPVVLESITSTIIDCINDSRAQQMLPPLDFDVSQSLEKQNYTIDLTSSDDSTHHFEVTLSPLTDINGTTSGFVIALHDVREHHKLVQKLSRQARHDHLTGLSNRPHFEEQMNLAFIECQETNAQHVLCCMDLDNFKQVNDACGHQAGDLLLKEIATAFKQRIRSDNDILARIGGDEFALLLKNCSLRRAETIANQLIKSVKAIEFTFDNKTFDVGVSIGMMLVDKRYSSAKECHSIADSACYSAKNAGKNCVYVYKDGLHDS